MPETGHPIHTENEIGRKWVERRLPEMTLRDDINVVFKGHAHELVVGKRSCMASTIGGRSGSVLPLGFGNALTDQQGER